MKRNSFAVLLPLLALLLLHPGYSNASAARIKDQLVQNKWKLEKKVLASHDQHGTDSMAAAVHKDDFIEFRSDGTAIVSYNGSKDTLQYELLNDTLLSFGTTPYRIQLLNGTALRLFQNEEEPNGDYNREWLELKK